LLILLLCASGSTFGFFFKVRRAENPGDFKGRPEEQSMDDDALEHLIKAHGHDADSTLEAEDVPKSVSDPPVEDTVAAPPDRSSQKDRRYEMTSRVASHIKEPEADSYKYANASDGEKQKRSGKSTPPRDAEVFEGSKERARTGHDSTPLENDKVSATAPRPGEVSSDASGRPKRETGDSGSSAEKKSTSRDSTQSGDDRVKHVLLVEDNAINQRIVNRKLQAKGFRVTTANNGREAVDAVREAPKHPSEGAFDIVLMDQEMYANSNHVQTYLMLTMST